MTEMPEQIAAEIKRRRMDVCANFSTPCYERHGDPDWDIPNEPWTIKDYCEACLIALALRRQSAEAARYREALEAIYQAARDDEKGEWWTLRKYLDAHDVYNGDIGDHRLFGAAAKYALRGKP